MQSWSKPGQVQTVKPSIQTDLRQLALFFDSSALVTFCNYYMRDFSSPKR